MKKSKKLFILTALTVMAVSTSNLSGMQGGFKDNLYEKIKYRNMFDQTDICADPRYRKSFENEGHDMKKLLEKPEYDSDGKEGLFKKMFHALTCDLFWNCMEKEEAPGKKDDDYFEQSEQALKEHSGETLVQIDYTSEYLDKILVREFRRRKRKYMRKAAFPVFGTCAFDVSTFLCGSRLMQRNEEKDDSDEKGNQNFGSSFAMLIGIDIIRRNVKDFTKAFVEYVSPSDDLDEFEELYAKRKRFLNKNLQDKVEDKFANARKDPKNLDKTKEFLRIALNIPIKDKKLNFTRETIEKIIKFADGHEPPITKPIILDLYNHYNRYSKGYGPLKTPKTVSYFLGKFGTRKSTIIKKAVELMGADIIELSASSSNPETLLGNEERPGALLEAIAKAGMSRNLFIFIDELDKSVNQDKADAGSLLKLLEPCEKYFYSPFLGCKVDTSHCTFLSAGNNPLICIKEDKPVDQEATDAMVSRFNVVEMGRVLPWRKKEIVQEIIDEMLINKNINRQSDSFKKLLEAIEKCIENDEEDGVRGVQRKVAALVNEFLFTREFGDDWSFLKPKNSEEVVVVSVE